MAAVLFAVDPAEQVKGLRDAAELRDRPPETGGAPAALQDAHQLGGADGCGGQRTGDAEDVFLLLDDQLDVDAVAGESIERAVVGVAVEAPEPLVG